MVKTHNERTWTGLPPGLGLVLAAVMLAAGCERTMPGAVSVRDGVVEGLKQELSHANDTGSVAPKPVPKPDGGFATLRGRFVLKGQQPRALVGFTPDKDREICAANGKVPNEALVIGSGNGIQNMMIYVDTKAFTIPVGDEDWEHQEYRDRMTAMLEGAEGFDQKECRFTSHVFAMRTSQKLQLANSDTVQHTVDTKAGGKAAGGNPSIPGKSFRLYEPGGPSGQPFLVSCATHRWMKGYMFVSDHPFFAVSGHDSVSGQDGAFVIKHVPSGVELEFRLWHESINRLKTVDINGIATPLSKSRFKRKFAKGDVVDLTIEIDISNFNSLFN